MKANVGRPFILSLRVLFIELKKFRSPIRDQELIISTYPMSQKLRGAPRLLFGNGCFYLDDIAEVKKKILSSRCKIKFSSNCCVLYYQMHLYCVFLDQKIKIVISNLNQDRFFQNTAAIKQHAIVEKKNG